MNLYRIRKKKAHKASEEKTGKLNQIADIFKEHGGFIRKIICWKLTRKQMADDVFQELFVVLVRRDLPEPIEDIRNFLYITIIRLVRDYERSVKRYEKHRRLFGELVPFEDENGTPEEELLERESARRIHACIRQLSRRESDAVKMRYEKDLRISEIAEQMKIKEHSARRVLTRAVTKLKQLAREEKQHG